jgi:hypothetical protein
MCCDYEIPLEEEQVNLIRKEKKVIQRTEFRNIEEKPIPA